MAHSVAVIEEAVGVAAVGKFCRIQVLHFEDASNNFLAVLPVVDADAEAQALALEVVLRLSS